VKSAKKASRAPAAAGSATAGKPSATAKVAAADKAARTYFASKRAPTGTTTLRTRADRRAEAQQVIAGRDISKLGVKEFARVREILGIPTQAGLTGAKARRTYLGQVREFLGPSITPSPFSE
jgi:hypothetical protein